MLLLLHDTLITSERKAALLRLLDVAAKLKDVPRKIERKGGGRGAC